MTKRFLVLLLIINLIGFIGCAGKTHQQRVDTISSVMHDINSAWTEVDSALLEMHKQQSLPENVRLIRNEVAKWVIKANENWKLVPNTDASIEAFINEQSFQSGFSLLMQLLEVAGKNDLKIQLNLYKRGNTSSYSEIQGEPTVVTIECPDGIIMNGVCEFVYNYKETENAR